MFPNLQEKKTEYTIKKFKKMTINFLPIQYQ